MNLSGLLVSIFDVLYTSNTGVWETIPVSLYKEPERLFINNRMALFIRISSLTVYLVTIILQHILLPLQVCSLLSLLHNFFKFRPPLADFPLSPAFSPNWNHFSLEYSYKIVTIMTRR